MAVTTGLLTASASLQGDTREIELGAPVQPGNSSGPVLDASGQLIGVATGMLNSLVLAPATGLVPQNANFAVKSDILKEFLASNQTNLDEGISRLGLSAPAIDKTA